MSMSRCGARASTSGSGLARPDVQVPEHQSGVHADDLEGAALCERCGDRGLAGRGGTRQEDDGARTMRRTGFRLQPSGSGTHASDP